MIAVVYFGIATGPTSQSNKILESSSDDNDDDDDDDSNVVV